VSPRLLLAALAPAALLAGGCGKIKDLVDPPMAEFTAPDGKWKAHFPGKPSETTKSAMNIQFTMFVKEPWGNKGGFMVGFADLPIPAREADHLIQKRMNDGVTGAVGGVGGTLKESKNILLYGKYPGREFSASVTSPKVGQFRCRMYLVGTRMYQVTVMGVDEFATAPRAQEFLDSFALVGETVPAHAPDGISNPAERLAVNQNKANRKKAAPAPDPDEPVAPPPPAGHPIHSTKGGYKARFPAEPKATTVTVGDVAYASQSATANGATFATGYADRAELEGEAQKKRQAALDDARDATVADLGDGAKLGKCELVVLAGRNRGWEFTGAAGDRHVRGRVYLVGNRIYRVTVRGSAEAVREDAVAAFLDSFQLAN
jgi:hypothetical protein